MRTLIDVKRDSWANVKHFATIKKLSLNLAVEKLLEQALSNVGYRTKEWVKWLNSSFKFYVFPAKTETIVHVQLIEVPW